MSEPKCGDCGNTIDRRTIDFWQRKREGYPRICGACMVIAMDALSIECNGKPIFDENWKTIKPGGK